MSSKVLWIPPSRRRRNNDVLSGRRTSFRTFFGVLTTTMINSAAQYSSQSIHIKCCFSFSLTQSDDKSWKEHALIYPYSFWRYVIERILFPSCVVDHAKTSTNVSNTEAEEEEYLKNGTVCLLQIEKFSRAPVLLSSIRSRSKWTR